MNTWTRQTPLPRLLMPVRRLGRSLSYTLQMQIKYESTLPPFLISSTKFRGGAFSTKHRVKTSARVSENPRFDQNSFNDPSCFALQREALVEERPFMAAKANP
jgi:hypothetical protein